MIPISKIGPGFCSRALCTEEGYADYMKCLFAASIKKRGFWSNRNGGNPANSVRVARPQAERPHFRHEALHRVGRELHHGQLFPDGVDGEGLAALGPQ